MHSLRSKLPAAFIALAAAAGFAMSSTALANEAQIQVLKQQIKMMEQNGMGDMAASMRDMVKGLEQEAAKSGAGNTAPKGGNVRASYYTEQGSAHLEACDAAREFQFDSICAASMLRYNDYLLSVSNNAPSDAQEEMWRRHAETAKVYINALR